VRYQIKNIQSLTQRVGVEPTKNLGAVAAKEVLKDVHQPSEEPYWKLRYKGACQDIFFVHLQQAPSS
jgi:hypothetical protein